MKQKLSIIIISALLFQGAAFADEDRVEMIGKVMLRTFGNSETTGYQAVGIIGDRPRFSESRE